jgi:hypothetical protein
MASLGVIVVGSPGVDVWWKRRRDQHAADRATAVPP